MSSFVSRFRAELFGQVVVATSGAILTVTLARLLGPDEYGLLFLAISVFGFFELFTKLGVGKSAARYIAEYKEKDSEQLSHIIRTSFILNGLTICTVVIFVILWYQEISLIIGEPGLEPFLLMGVLYLIFSTYAKYIRYILQGFEAIELAAAIHAVDRGTRLFFAVGFVIMGYGALGALAGYILAFVIAVALGFGLIYTRYYNNREQVPIEEELRCRLIKYTVPLTATSTANVLDKRVDTILVGFFLSPISVSYYIISKQLIEFIEKPVQALGFTLSPTFGAEKANDNIERASTIYETALIYSLVLYIPAATGLILISEPLIELVFGSDYLGAVLVIQVLSLYAILQSVTKVTSNSLDFLGRARDRAIVKGITSILNVGLNILLIPTIGVVGAAIATVMTYSLYTLANVYIVHQEFDLRMLHLIRHIIKISAATICMALPVYGLVGLVNGVITLTITILVGASIYAIIILNSKIIDVDDIKNRRYKV